MDIFGEKRLQKGTMFGSYQIIEEIGRGGMGVVYKALEVNPQRFVAIKIILDQQQRSKRRFLREADLASKLEHSNIRLVPVETITLQFNLS